MIDIHEIRIGNKFLYKGEIITVLTIELDEPVSHRKDIVYEYIIKFGDDFCSVNELTPIQLTPEILEKCRFNKTNDLKTFEIRLGENIIYLYVTFYEGIIISLGDRYISKEYIMVIPNLKCEYLHQLLNLYFAFTGIELTVNL